MKMLSVAVAYAIFLGCTGAGLADGPLSFNDGDRILFVGNGFVENDQWNAHFEARLQRRLSDRNVTFRYMGWSGDTVRGSARTAGFQVPQGLARLEKEAKAQQPTVIFLAYGMNESFDGPRALPEFLTDYDKLLKALAPLKTRLVIMSPAYHEDRGRPYPDPGEHNRCLEQFTKALKAFAQERKLPFVDLFHPLAAEKKADAARQLSTNGILLTEAGYALAGKAIEEQLGFEPYRWKVTLDRTGKVSGGTGTKLTAVSAKTDTIRFQAADVMLPITGDVHRLRITGLPPGDFLLKIDGENVLHAAAAAWQDGVPIATGPMFTDGEKLREAIVLRNQLFYRRWRPYNDHSRHWGFIGGDFKLYDRDIAQQEKRIAELRRPQARSYEISRKSQ
jgi:lysophospholipase L1-like esterase